MDQNLTVGEVINGTIATVADNKAAAIAYVAVFTALGTGLEWGLSQVGTGLFDQFADAEWLLAVFGVSAGIGGILFVIVAVVGQYLLWEAMLRQRHYLVRGYDRRFLAFFGLSILTGIGVAFGFLLLIIPGLIFMSRWAMAPAYLMVEREGVIDSMGGSWDAVKGNTTPVALALLVGGLLLFGLAVITGLGSAFSGDATGQVPLIESLAGQFLSQVGTVLSAALGVFLFARLHGSSRELTGVFE
jgi:hypothetical protein